jgi:hypothetical protein
MYKLPAASLTAQAGSSNCAFVARPPIPESPSIPVPATVEISGFGAADEEADDPHATSKTVMPKLALPIKTTLNLWKKAAPPPVVCLSRIID